MIGDACNSFDDADDPIQTLAQILARGVLRLRQADLEAARIASDSSDHGLALCSSSCPPVVDGSESRRKEHA